MSLQTATKVAEILADEGYSAFAMRTARRRAKIVTNAPDFIVASVRALVGDK